MKKHLKSLVLTLFKYRATWQSVMAFSSLVAINSYGPAHAALPHDILLPADELDLSVPCAETHITVDTRLKSGIIIKATHGTAPVMTQGRDGAQNRLSLSYGTCTQGASLSVMISPATTLSIHDSAEAKITEKGKLAALEINLQDGTLSADTIESLDMAANGASHIKIHQLDRAAQIASVANSEIQIDQVNLTAFSATMGDTSTLHVNSGLINVVTLFLSNQSKAELHASIGKAGVTANDQSMVKIGPLLGAMMPRGSGTIETIEKETLSDKKDLSSKVKSKKAPSPEEQKEAAIAAETKAFLQNASTPSPSSSQPSSSQPVNKEAIPAVTAKQSSPSGQPASKGQDAIPENTPIKENSTSASDTAAPSPKPEAEKPGSQHEKTGQVSSPSQQENNGTDASKETLKPLP